VLELTAETFAQALRSACRYRESQEYAGDRDRGNCTDERGGHARLERACSFEPPMKT
jgi:hypothetical protein